jgi:drug/metabolite transporter superfamily protein YnfA
MKSVFLTLFANLASLACIVGAIWLALKDKTGWGWFLMAGVVLAVGAVTLGSDGKRKDDA